MFFKAFMNAVQFNLISHVIIKPIPALIATHICVSALHIPDLWEMGSGLEWEVLRLRIQ